MSNYNDMSNEDCTALELLIDKYSLARVVGTCSCIAEEKAEHVLTTWNDKALAAMWRKSARILDKASAGVARLFAERI